MKACSSGDNPARSAPPPESDDRLNALRRQLASVPQTPGVYLMKDGRGRIIYVGKAQQLRKRLASYFRPPGRLDPKTRLLVRNIAAFETVLTKTEKEALLLESNLIKRHRPRYNVSFRDDKRYPALRLDTREVYPNLTVVRKMKNDGARYFGPFDSAGAVHQTLKFIHRTFKIRKCKTREFLNRTRPCLNYQIGACLGPCCLDVKPEAYHEMVKEVILFLKGRTPELIRKVKQQMDEAARRQDYERAAALRDKMFALQKTLEKQVAVSTDRGDRDAIGLARGAELSVLTLMSVRGGYLIGTRHFYFEESLGTDGEMCRAFIQHYYDGAAPPGEVLVPVTLEDSPLLEDWLQQRRGRKVHIRWPQRGEKAALMQLAGENARNRLEEKLAARTASAALLAGVQRKLGLKRPPQRIECFDNSTLAGREPVAAMVVFIGGRPAPSQYRRYRLHGVAEPDDYAYMNEVLRRRLLKTDETGRPDLLLVDGGKGQLNIAAAVLAELGLQGRIAVAAIAKKDEARGETADKIYLPGRVNAVDFSRDSELLLLLQRIRDEAHRFAISFHRRRHRQASLRSALDSIHGVGPKRKAALLKHFGSLGALREASIEELSTVAGMNRKTAETLKTALGNSAQPE